MISELKLFDSNIIEIFKNCTKLYCNIIKFNIIYNKEFLL